MTPRPVRVRAMENAVPWIARPSVLGEAAREFGYLYLPGVLDGARLDALRGDLLEVCARMHLAEPAGARSIRARTGARLFPYSGDPWVRLQQEVALLESFRKVGADAVLLDILGTLFGTRVQTDRGSVCRVFLPHAPELATPAHQDLFFLEKTAFESPHRIWGAWVPVVDCPLELGPVAVLPRSHDRGLLAHDRSDDRGFSIEVPDDTVWSSSDLRVGDVVLISCLTVHRALPNRTADRVRLSVDYRYQPG